MVIAKYSNPVCFKIANGVFISNERSCVICFFIDKVDRRGEKRREEERREETYSVKIIC
jgi:hypothetical protein